MRFSAGVGWSGCHIILPSLICKPKRSGGEKGRPRVAADSFFAPIRLPFVFLFSSEEGEREGLKSRRLVLDGRAGAPPLYKTGGMEGEYARQRGLPLGGYGGFHQGTIIRSKEEKGSVCPCSWNDAIKHVRSFVKKVLSLLNPLL